MRVLVACEYSGVVRDAFLGGGHDAISGAKFRSQGISRETFAAAIKREAGIE